MATLLVSAQAQQTNCDALPESRQPLCLMIEACTAIDDPTRRQECYQAAANSLGDTDTATTAQPADPEPAPVSKEPSQVPNEPAPALEPALVSEEVAPTPRVPTPATIAPTPQPAEPNTQGRGSRAMAAVAKLFQSPTSAEGQAIPKRFTATVTAHRDLIRDRQLLVLDNALLFEGERAASTSIDIGDEVRVVKSSSFRGRTYQNSGPSRRPFQAIRIRCERADLKTDARRKCDGLLYGAQTGAR